jgi:DNA replication and repair protein RecF
VKGDPAERRRFADDLLVLQAARYAGTRADYDRVLKQRNSLLKTARVRGAAAESMLATLGVWDERLARLGAEIMAARARLVEELNPLLGKAYEAVARGASRDDAMIAYKPSFEVEAGAVGLEEALLAEVARRRQDELDRGVSLVGPHRDDLFCSLCYLPDKGYASHGEGWSFALAMRLASYELLRSTGDDPVLILDDVFAELDSSRRAQLADLVVGAEQVLVTAAVPEDIPDSLRGRRFDVAQGQVTPVG